MTSCDSQWWTGHGRYLGKIASYEGINVQVGSLLTRKPAKRHAPALHPIRTITSLACETEMCRRVSHCPWYEWSSSGSRQGMNRESREQPSCLADQHTGHPYHYLLYRTVSNSALPSSGISLRIGVLATPGFHKPRAPSMGRGRVWL